MFIFVLPHKFFNNRSNFGITLAWCFPCLLSFIQKKNDDLMFFYQIDDKINSYYLFIQTRFHFGVEKQLSMNN